MVSLPAELLSIIFWIYQVSGEDDRIIALVCRQWSQIVSGNNFRYYHKRLPTLMRDGDIEYWGYMNKDDKIRLILVNQYYLTPIRELDLLLKAGWYDILYGFIKKNEKENEVKEAMFFLISFILGNKELYPSRSLLELIQYFSKRFSKEWNPLFLYSKQKYYSGPHELSYWSRYGFDELYRKNLVKEFPKWFGFFEMNISEYCRFCCYEVCECECRRCHQIGNACKCWCYNCNMYRRLSRFENDYGQDGQGLCYHINDSDTESLSDDVLFDIWNEDNPSNNYRDFESYNYFQVESLDLYLNQLESWALQTVYEPFSFHNQEESLDLYLNRLESWAL